MKRNNVYADLHMHTKESDGENSLEEMIEEARSKGLKAIAITDHDVPHSKLSRDIEKINGIEVIKGIELRVETPGFGRVDLLGYGVEVNQDLQKEIEKIKKGRLERAKSVVKSIEESYDIELDIDLDNERVGRPHIADSIDRHPELDYDYQDAFQKLIGNDCDHYESRYVTPVQKGIDLLQENCNTISIAHPFLYEKPKKVLQLQNLVDGVEYYYPYGRDLDLSPVDKDNILTGGSDAHGIKRIGVTGLNKEEYQNFKVNFFNRYE